MTSREIENLIAVLGTATAMVFAASIVIGHITLVTASGLMGAFLYVVLALHYSMCLGGSFVTAVSIKTGLHIRFAEALVYILGLSWFLSFPILFVYLVRHKSPILPS